MPWIDWFVSDEGHHLPKPVSRWVVLLGRTGYFARGVIYFCIGLLALMAVLGLGGDLTDWEGAMHFLNQLPLGPVLVIAVLLGLISYNLWRLAEGIFNLEHYDRSWYSFAVRCYFIADGIFHGVFAVMLARAVFADGGDAGDEDTAREWTAQVLMQPFGRWLVGLAGVLTAAGGIYLFLRVYWRPFLGELKRNRLPTGVGKLTVCAACAGEAARGLIFVIIGIFLTRAAVRVDPDETRDFGAAMAELAQQPFGPQLLGTVAAGFILYGIYSMVEAFYRRIGRGLAQEAQPQQ
jgi:drug/metabolite transporter superfamily protein YnfA